MIEIQNKEEYNKVQKEIWKILCESGLNALESIAIMQMMMQMMILHVYEKNVKEQQKP